MLSQSAMIMTKSELIKNKHDTRNKVNPETFPHLFTSNEKPTEMLSTSLNKQFSTWLSNQKIANNKHREYLNSLEIPSREQMNRIGAIQECKEIELTKRRLDEKLKPNKSSHKCFSGNKQHLEGRPIFGLSMSPTDRWVEAVREACYRILIEPYERDQMKHMLGDLSHEYGVNDNGNNHKHRAWRARRNWRKVGSIVRRAGRDEDPSLGVILRDSSSQQSNHCNNIGISRNSTKGKIRKTKLLDLQYFLEMVDPKHRYAANLRIYHELWRKLDVQENFFYWLDYGEGLQISFQACPRERLERERVRYLSKEERSNYLVALDCNGRLYWAKNGNPVDTTENYRDSINGIVPITDSTPLCLVIPPDILQEKQKYEENNFSVNPSSLYSSLQKSILKYKNNSKCSSATAYATTKLSRSPNVKMIRHISVATIVDRLLRGSVKKNTWIFVADTNFRLYVGMKQSGIFQHSSFLHGSRISAAGSIKVVDGKLSKLSPLSGHYRPPVTNFRAFLRALREAGVETSQISISRSYFILIGLETYLKTRHITKQFFKHLVEENSDLSIAHKTSRASKKKRKNEKS